MDIYLKLLKIKPVLAGIALMSTNIFENVWLYLKKIFPSWNPGFCILFRHQLQGSVDPDLKKRQWPKKRKTRRNFIFSGWICIRWMRKWYTARDNPFNGLTSQECLPERRTAPASRRVSTPCTLAGGRGIPLRTYCFTAHQSESSSSHLSSFLTNNTLKSLYTADAIIKTGF